MKEKLPKWMDLSTYDRHKLLGELIDAMIYSGEAVHYLKVTVEQFRAMGWVRSIIMPEVDLNNYTNDKNQNNDKRRTKKD
jgi:hypothetical protein